MLASKEHTKTAGKQPPLFNCQKELLQVLH